MEYLLYVLATMIFWDFSIHVIELFDKQSLFLKSRSPFSYYYPHLSYKKSPQGPVLRENRNMLYQRFWVGYWGIALLLVLTYLILG
jgi:hypothetical protein